MAGVNIPDEAYAAAESALDAVHVCDNGGCCFRGVFSDVAVDTAAPLIVAANRDGSVALPFDARDQIEKALLEKNAPNHVGHAAVVMRLLMSWQRDGS